MAIWKMEEKKTEKLEIAMVTLMRVVLSVDAPAPVLTWHRPICLEADDAPAACSRRR